MTTVRDSLFDVINEISALHRAGTLGVHLDLVLDRLEALIEPAVEWEKDVPRFIISLLNLLLEWRRGKLLPATLGPFLSDISTSLDRPASLPANLLQGEEVQAESLPELRMGCTMMTRNDFDRFYAARYGFSRSDADKARLDRRIEAGDLRIPREDLRLSSKSGLIWITDEEALRTHCSVAALPGQIDGTKAYDALGLAWESGWRYARTASEAPAVVLSAPTSQRREAARGLRLPTSIDAWGNFGFVPKQGDAPRTWPTNAGVTVDPTKGSEHLPEAVHGPALVAAGTECPVLPCTPVRKTTTGRVDECGRMVCLRAIAALRAS